MTGDAVDGGCLCGTVRFRIRLPPKWCAHCHCTMCRRAHGAAFVTWVGSRTVDFELLAGEVELRRYHSSPPATRSFCGRCGSMLFFESSRWPDEVHVTLASLDSDAGLVPAGHAYWDDRVHWAQFAEPEPPKVGPDDPA